MSKNLVVCLDGTNNEFGAENTNIVRLYQILADQPDRQTRYYDPGVGTIGHPGAITSLMQKITKGLGMAFGLGVTANLIKAYCFLMQHYEPEDRIFIFGFSRGSLEARALAAMLYRCGLLRPELTTLTPYAVRVFQTLHNEAIAAEFRATFSRPVDTYFLGLWDTVTSFGNVWSPIDWPNTTNNPGVRHVRHAIALDERRAFFRQNRWGRAAMQPGQDVRERWFAGVHCDVGGGYPLAESTLWAVTMEWMMAEAGSLDLLVDQAKLDGVFARAYAANGGRPLYLTLLHDSMPGLGPLWYVAEGIPRRRFLGVGPDGKARREWIWPVWQWFSAWLLKRGKMGRARSVGRARELLPGDRLHRSVLARFAGDSFYRPDSLVSLGLTVPVAQAFLAGGEESFLVPDDLARYKM